jgi:hypothetical protein
MFYVTEEYLSVDLVNFYGIAGSQMTKTGILQNFEL